MDSAAKTVTLDPARRAAPRKPRRWLPYLLGVILVGAIVAGLWPRPTPVETGRVVVGPLRTSVNEEGKTRVKQRFVISAPVGGQLRRIPFKAGAEVKAGETVLAVIDPLSPTMLDARSRALAEARRDTAAANLERARSAHSFAENDLKRAEKLSAEHTISPQELENVQWREVSTAKDLSAAESALRQAEAELIEAGVGTGASAGSPSRQPVRVVAPTSGRVLRVLEESTRVITSGTALMEIGDPADLEVVIDVLSRDGAVIARGTPVELDEWGGAEPLQARVRYVEPAAFTKISALGVEEQRVNVVADILTPGAQRQQLGDGFRVEGHIITWQTNSALKVPSGAVFRHDGQPAAFVVRDGRAHLQRLTTGRSSGTEVQVLAGLKEGDEVIVYPGDRIQDDTRVNRLKISTESSGRTKEG